MKFTDQMMSAIYPITLGLSVGNIVAYFAGKNTIVEQLYFFGVEWVLIVSGVFLLLKYRKNPK